MKIIGNNPAANNAEITAVASGTLPSGQPVVVNADGTVSVAGETNVSQAVGTPTVFQSGNTEATSAAYDANAQKVVVAYKDDGASLGKAVVGTVSGNAISFGTPVTFASAIINYTSTVYDANAQKIVIAYQDSSAEQGKAVVGTVSGTSISFGTPVVFDSSARTYHSATYDSNAQKVAIFYADSSNYGKAVVGTVSGTSISFGSITVYNSATTQWISSTFDSLNNKCVVAFRGATSGYGESKVATVSGTSISFGSSTIFSTQTSGGTGEISAVFDSSANKVVIGWQDGTDSNKGAAVVGTVSGTSISFGSKVFFSDSASGDISGTFDSTANKVVFFYRDNSNSNQGTLNSGTVSGTSITFGTEAIFETGGTYKVSSTFDSNAQKVVVAYRDNNDSLNGKAAVFQTAYTSTNLTAENYIGMSGGVVDDNSVTQAVGSAVVFESATADLISATFDSNLNKVVVTYQDEGNSGYGTSVVGTLSGNSISFGTPVVFNSANSDFISSTFDSSNNKVVISFRDLGNGARGKAIVGTVSGTSISFGTEVDFNTTEIEDTSITFDSNSNKVVISWNDKVNNAQAGTSIVGTVSGTNISFGSAVVFAAPITRDIVSTFDSNSNKVVISYRDGGNSQAGTAIIGTVSGTSISFGTEVVFQAAAADLKEQAITFDTSSNKVVIAYANGANSNYGTAVVGTVSGTSISFGTPVVFEAASVSTARMGASYDSSVSRVVISYRDNGNSNYGTLIVGAVSGTSISFESPVVYEAATTDDISSTFDSNSNKVVIAYQDGGNSNYGTAVVTTTGYTDITRGQVADGDNAVVDIGSAISTNQVGLTAGQQYFVQTDGTLGLTAADPSVIAGTAVSATDIIVKG